MKEERKLESDQILGAVARKKIRGDKKKNSIYRRAKKLEKKPKRVSDLATKSTG